MTDSPEQSSRISLSRLIYESFDVGELTNLVYSLGLEAEEIAADRKSAMVTNLLRYVARVDPDKALLARLIDYCRRRRPEWPWPDPATVDLAAAVDLDWQSRKEQEALFSDLIRPERIPAYKQLWALLEPLARYSPPGPFTFEAAAALSNSMRHWYFDGGGGMFLSESSRATYFPVQEYLVEHILANRRYQKNPGAPLPAETVTTLRRLGSLLRAALAEDIGIGRVTSTPGPIPSRGTESYAAGAVCLNRAGGGRACPEPAGGRSAGRCREIPRRISE